MEPKKNPKYDVHQKRGIFFNISLVISLSIVIMAFKWTMPVNDYIPPDDTSDVLRTEDIIYATFIEQKTEVQKPKRERRVVSDPTEFVEAKPDDIIRDMPDIEIETDPIGDLTISDVPIDSTYCVHDSHGVEKKPEPEGGMESFYNILRKNIKYPLLARRNETEGKVFVQFTVAETGALTDFKILKGIGSGCDEEAIRVVSLTKWKPGKQRGKPVKVRMVQPIVFGIKK